MNNMESGESNETIGTKKSKLSKKGKKKKKKKKRRAKSKSGIRQQSKQKQLKEKYDIQSFESGSSGEYEVTERLSEDEYYDESKSSLGPKSTPSVSPIRRSQHAKANSNIPPKNPNHQSARGGPPPPGSALAPRNAEESNRSGALTNFHHEISSARVSDGKRSQLEQINQSTSAAQAQTQRCDDKDRSNNEIQQTQQSQSNFSAASDFDQKKQQIFEEMMQKRQQKHEELKRKYGNNQSRQLSKSPAREQLDRSAERPPKSPKLQQRPINQNKEVTVIDNKLKSVQEQIDELRKQKELFE